VARPCGRGRADIGDIGLMLAFGLMNAWLGFSRFLYGSCRAARVTGLMAGG